MVLRMLNKINESGIVERRRGSGRPISATTENNRQLVIQYCQNRRGRSARKASAALNISCASVRRLMKVSGLKPYHRTRASRITEWHKEERVVFSRWLLCNLNIF